MKSILKDYQAELIREIEKIDEAEFNKAICILRDAYRQDRQIFVVGNGGSAGTANHFVCDLSKNAVPQTCRRPRVHSLCDNIEFITALGNDIDFEQVFSFQLGNQMREGDAMIVISASGNSQNLVNACALAKERGGSIIALSGFGGGKICDGAAARLVTDMTSYERIEDLHLILLHMFVCTFKENQDCLA